MVREFPGFREVQRLHTGDRSTVDRAVRVADAVTVIIKQPAGNLVASEALGRVQREHDLEALQLPWCSDSVLIHRS